MKLNRSTIFLLIALVAIWGGIVYVIYKKLKGDDGEKVMTQQRVVNQKTDSFSLLLNYDSPFIGSNLNSVSTGQIKVSANTSSSTDKATENSSVEVERIVYLGLIQNSKSKKKSILLRIDGEEYVVQIGEVIGDFKLINASDNDVIIRNTNGVFVLKRN